MMGRMAGEWNSIQSIQTVTCRTGAEGSLFRLALKAQCRGRLEWQWGGEAWVPLKGVNIIGEGLGNHSKAE